MGKLDPQVQIRIIDITKELAELHVNYQRVAESNVVDNRLKQFDRIYRELVKSISES